jgi:hypothetical protein
LEAYLVRLASYLFSLSRDLRLQAEAVILTTFLFALYFSLMVATFDDDHEEAIEVVMSVSFYLFLGMFAHLLYRYALHYFAFLQASETKGKYLRLLTQVSQDIVNTFALFLRFIVLLVRLNMYDFLDDVLDSYYIFVCDFDDDEYYAETNLALSTLLFFDTDNLDDRTAFLEDELDARQISLDFTFFSDRSLSSFFSLPSTRSHASFWLSI